MMPIHTENANIVAYSHKVACSTIREDSDYFLIASQPIGLSHAAGNMVMFTHWQCLHIGWDLLSHINFNNYPCPMSL